MKKRNIPWDEQAERFLIDRFLPRTYGQSFLMEQFRRAAEKHGVSMPADPHEWGGFALRMKHRGVIRRTSFGLDQFGSPKSMWRAA